MRAHQGAGPVTLVVTSSKLRPKRRKSLGPAPVLSGKTQQTRSDFNAQREALVTKAKRQTRAADKRAAGSARGKITGLRQNRQEEREQERRIARAEFDAALGGSVAPAAEVPSNIIPIISAAPTATKDTTAPAGRSTQALYVPPPSYGDILDETWDEP